MRYARAALVISMACILAAPNVAAGPESTPSAHAAASGNVAGRPHQLGSGSARSGGLSNSAKWLLVGAVSFSLALGTLGFSLRSAGRRPPNPGNRPGQPLLSNLAGRKNPARELNPSPRRICPACGLQYRENVRFCGRDGSPLLLITPNH